MRNSGDLVYYDLTFSCRFGSRDVDRQYKTGVEFMGRKGRKIQAGGVLRDPSLRSATVCGVKWSVEKTAMKLPRKTGCVSRFSTLPAAGVDYVRAGDWLWVCVVAWNWRRTSRALALSRISSLCASAMRMTLGGLPAAASRWRKAMKSGS